MIEKEARKLLINIIMPYDVLIWGGGGKSHLRITQIKKMTVFPLFVINSWPVAMATTETSKTTHE